MGVYSHSKLSNYEQCPLKYKFRYIDKIEEGESIEGFLGSQVHEALHFIYEQAKIGNVLSLANVLGYYKDLWDKKFNKDIRIVKKDFTAKDYFEKGLIFIQQYYEKNYPFDENVLSMEQKILVDLDGSSSFIIQGYIDKLVFDKEKNIYEIHDYKTSNWLKSQEELDGDRQLALYAIGVKELYPDADNVVLKWHFLKHNVVMSSFRTEMELENLKQEVIKLIKEIENCKEYPAKTSTLCHWCGYKNLCQEYKKMNS